MNQVYMQRSRQRLRGMALIAVLWIVAALAILATGMTQSVRQQVRVTASTLDAVAAQAVGDGAIALVLQALKTMPQRPQQAVTETVVYGGGDIAVEVMPLDGLISLNGASVPLLAALLQVAGGLPAPNAEALAQQLDDWRTGRSGELGTPVPRHFEAPEDLLLVPGIDYTLYARLRPLVTTEQRGGDRVNPLAAPPAVLAVLARGDAALAGRIVAQRAASAVGVDTTGLDPALAGSSGSTYFYRLVARVPLGEGKILGFTRDVALDSFSPRTAPWRTLRSERQLLAIDGA